MTNQEIKQKIIQNGVNNLKESYPQVDDKNILTDKIYSAFFKVMLENNLGRGFDEVINEILVEIEQKENEET